MKQLLPRVILVLVIVSFLGINTNAYQNNLSFRGGVFIPTGDASDFDMGPDIKIAYTYMLNENMGIEAGVGYFMIDYKETWGPNDWVKAEYSAIPVTATFKYLFNPGQQMDFYVGAGIGLYMINYEIEWKDEWDGSFKFDDSDTEFGFHLLGGIDYWMSDTMALGFEAQYTSVDDLDGIQLGLTLRFVL